ncbi:MAG: CCA tRNA nucleotidyltransferase [Elusimicrobia bacterium]|nr:CCA tRNA nucleotidyltransferase [Elusimicrobiota bacterium]
MELKPLNDLPLLEKAAGLASAAGLELYAVGGCARDWLLGRESADIDFLLNGDPAAVVEGMEKAYGGSHRKFTPFLTVRFFSAEGRRLDFARFRKEIYEKPAALPTVSAAASAEEDLKRRDFSCNAMAVRLDGPEPFGLVDPYKGLEDIKSGLVRVLHEKSFEDDPTRVFRAARFCGRFGWKLEAGTRELALAAVRGGFPGLLSRERLRNELVKILGEADPLPALEMLRWLDALAFIHPSFAFDSSVSRQEGARCRLAALAALMGAAGEEFAAGLRYSKKETAEILKISAGLRRC